MSRAGWIHPRRRLRFTREGWFFLLVTVAIGLAALNTGHNLFYLVFAFLVSMIVVSGLLSEGTVARFAIERALPRDGIAGTPLVIEVRLRNQSPKRSSYGVEVRDGLAGEAPVTIGRVARLDPGETTRLYAVRTVARRGRHRFDAIELVTRFPFGLFEKTRVVPLASELVVAPASGTLPAAASGRDGLSARLRRKRTGEETLGLRPALADDDHRRIHWRSSARVDSLLVREPAEPVDRPLAIFLDDHVAPGEPFERQVEVAAGFVRRAVQEGARLTLYTHDASFPIFGRDGARGALEALADVAARPGGGAGEGFRRWRDAVESGAGGVRLGAAA